MNKTQLKSLIGNKTGCRAQYTGWPCNTCFHSIDLQNTTPDRLHEYWEAVLLFRGDYKAEDIPIGKEEMNKRISELVAKLES